MRKSVIAAIVAGTLLTVGMVPAGVKVLAQETAAQTDHPARARNGPLANFIRATLGRLTTLRAELDLTDAQKQQLRQIVQSHKSEIIAAMKPVIEKRRALHDAILAETTDEKAIRAAADDLGHSLGDLSVLAARIKQEAAAVLTPDQKQKLADFRQQMEKSVDDLMNKIGSNPQ
ncbi:MAG: Spy/CpxP family protein refolding chaperone [Phycisphaerae bacterium]